MNARLIPLWDASRASPRPRPGSGCCARPPTCSPSAGYDGTRVADIAAAAGVSNGALYAHFASKADLLVDALRTHGRHLLGRAVRRRPGPAGGGPAAHRGPVAAAPPRRARLPHRRGAGRGAARRGRGPADARATSASGPTGWPAWCELAQARGELDPALSPAALAHFCLLLAMGSALITPDLHAIGEDEWAALLARVVGGARHAARHERGMAHVKVQIDSGTLPGPRPLLRPRPGPVRRGRRGLRAGARRRRPCRRSQERDARLAVANCPEHAIEVLEEP